MTSHVAQDYINSRQEELQYSYDAMHKTWGGYNQFKKQAEVLHREAKKVAIQKMSNILAETAEKETLKKIEKICDSLISEAMAVLNANWGQTEVRIKHQQANRCVG
jgi:hypothetical protein